MGGAGRRRGVDAELLRVFRGFCGARFRVALPLGSRDRDPETRQRSGGSRLSAWTSHRYASGWERWALVDLAFALGGRSVGVGAGYLWAVEAMSGGPIVLFDGVCNLCNGTVDFMLRRDRRGRFRYASLQGGTAAGLVADAAELGSVALWENGRMYRRSEAGLRMIEGLGGGWRLLAVLRLVPRPVRDGVYDWIARNRYRWFGKRESCRMPTDAERGRFLP